MTKRSFLKKYLLVKDFFTWMPAPEITLNWTTLVIAILVVFCATLIGMLCADGKAGCLAGCVTAGVIVCLRAFDLLNGYNEHLDGGRKKEASKLEREMDNIYALRLDAWLLV